MKTEQKVIAHFLPTEGATLCNSCYASDRYEHGAQIFATDKTEYRQTCDVCEKVIWEGQLTDDERNY